MRMAIVIVALSGALCVAISGTLCTGAAAQSRAGPDSAGISRFALETTGLFSRGPARPWAFVSEQGRRAALFGDETGSFEAWIWPMKLVRDLQLAFKVPEYDEPIPGAALAREIIARPEGVTIVYSHSSFTVRQHVFVPLSEPGALILLEVEAVRPLDIVVSMQAEFNPAWPGSFGDGSITWQADRQRFLLTQGGVRFYNAFIGSPRATNSTPAAAHDSRAVPSQFRIKLDSATMQNSYIPIVIAGGATVRDSVELVYRRLLERAPTYWREKVDHYREVRRDLLSIASPDVQLDQALEWSKVNLDQQQVCNPDLGCGLIAAFGRGNAALRPGFSWFFGGDAAINSLAMSGIGQLEMVRDGLRFLARRQRADGRIAHEVSSGTPRHGNTTAFWILACHAYWTASGDDEFLRQLWPSIAKAFRWSASTDSDGDGLMENQTASAGAREIAAPGDRLWTDIYLAGVWVAALEGMGDMARAAGDGAVASQASALFERAQQSLETRFWLDEAGIYGSALLEPAPGLAGPHLNEALTVWPSVPLSFGLLDDARADRMLREISSAAITADWGTRTLSRFHRVYDPLHASNGTVWPLATGFAALAHYRYHRGWAGFDLVRDVARSSFDFARGRTPELLSGAFYDVPDSALPQQFSGTAMYVYPLVKGLLGVQADAPNRALQLEPHLPAEWNSLEVNNIRVGPHRVSMSIRRGGGKYEISLRRTGPATPLFVRLSPALPLGARVERAQVNDRDVAIHVEETAHDVHAQVELSLSSAAEVEIEYNGGLEVGTVPETLHIGDGSTALKVLDFKQDGRDYVILVEGVPTATYTLGLRAETRVRSVLGADLIEQANQRVVLRLRVGAGTTQFVRREIRLKT